MLAHALIPLNGGRIRLNDPGCVLDTRQSRLLNTL
jgi:hypothetical protein